MPVKSRVILHWRTSKHWVLSTEVDNIGNLLNAVGLSQ